MKASVKTRERLFSTLLQAAAILCVASLPAIFGFLALKSYPALKEIGIRDFLLGTVWSPDRLDTYGSALSGRYGIFPMIVGTLAASAGALLVGGLLGFFTAAFLAFFCPRRLKGPLKTVIHLLAGIPSVVWGFFGITFLLPLLANIAPNNGSGLLAVSLILGFMILPTVVSLSETAMESVPESYYAGALALGATHSRAVFGVMIPAARSGIAASLVLGLGRAMGETMAVVMVAGNAPTYPSRLFGSFRVLTANIVMEMGYAGEVQEGALVASGVVLLVFVAAVQLLLGALNRSGEKKKRKANRQRKQILPAIPHAERLGKGASVACGGITALVLVLILGFILAKGLPPLLASPNLIGGAYQFGSSEITILPAIVSTLMAVALSLLIAIPLGILTAIYLNEYTRPGSRLVALIRGGIDLLGGVPSVVYGLFGMIAFVPLLGGSSSILAGSLTVALMLLPTVVRSVEESLKAVPEGLREGSLALGAGKMRTTLRIVLPCALPGILSAILLSMGRVISESAPFLYTMGSVIGAMPDSYLDSGATLAVALYQLSGEGWHIEEAYATAVVLVVMVLLLNLASGAIGARLETKMRGNKHG